MSYDGGIDNNLARLMRGAEELAYEAWCRDAVLTGPYLGVASLLEKANSLNKEVTTQIRQREFADEFPMLARADQAAPHEERHIVCEVIEWLKSKYEFCEWRDAGNNGEYRFLDPETGQPTSYADYAERIHDQGRVPRDSWSMPENPMFESWPEGFYPAWPHPKVTDLVGEFFGIDAQQYAEEQAKLLEWVRTGRI